MAIEIERISKVFGSFQALHDVSLNIKDGELVALLGPSGSGKTTLLRIIAGLDIADRGRVMIDGVNASQLHVKERNVGFVFQHYALFKHMTVFENVAFGLRVRPKELRPSRQEIEERVFSLLRLVHLDSFAHRYPSQLSGGQRQRVALARSLAVEPKLLLLDEPFGALDAKVRKELRRWLRRLHDDIQITTIFVTHDQEEAMEVSDRVVVMNHGQIEQVGTPEEVYHQPANGFIYDFLGNYNEFTGWKDTEGQVHLVEDDVWQHKPSIMPQHPGKNLLGRYPSVAGLVKRVFPNINIPRPLPDGVQVPFGKAQPGRKGKPVRIYARPHEMFVTKTPDTDHEYIPAQIVHINPAGALVTIEMQRKNGTILQAEVPKTIVDSFDIRKYDQIFVRPKNVRVFE